MTIEDSVGAFVAHGRAEQDGASTGPLRGLTFALKDLFDVAGVPTGAGNPDWLASHDVPDRSASIVEALLAAGARLVGKTHTDEMAWSLNGENFHYGTPENVAAPGRIPGGSSSGSAAAVAAGLADVSIGSDTGGSVRLPASYCGIFGMRPTHGRVPIDGAVALARSYDTVGWFARDAATLARVGRVLLGSGGGSVEPSGAAAAPRTLLVADDMWASADRVTREALAPALERASALFSEVRRVSVAGDRAVDWREVFRVIQSAEAWAEHGAWVLRVSPRFGPGVRQRFEAAEKLTPAEITAAQAARREICAIMEELVPPGAVLVLPTVPGMAPLRGTSEPDLHAFRARAIEMLCPAGHAGMPQVSLPSGLVDGCPVGLSFLGPRGEDETLLGLAGLMAA